MSLTREVRFKFYSRGVGFLRYFQLKQLPNFLLASPILSLAVCSIVYYVKLWPEVFLSLGLRVPSEQSKLAGSRLSTSTSGISEHGTPKALQGMHFTVSYKNLFFIVLFSSGGNSTVFDHQMRGLLDWGRKVSRKKYNLFQRHQKAKHNVIPLLFFLLLCTWASWSPQHFSSCMFRSAPNHISLSSIPLSWNFAEIYLYRQVSTRFLSASPLVYWFASHIMGSPSSSGKRWGHFIWAYSAAYVFIGTLLFSNFYPFTWKWRELSFVLGLTFNSLI